MTIKTKRPTLEPRLVKNIPSGWSICTLGELFDISAGGDWDPQNSSKVRSNEFKYPVFANALSRNAVQGWANYFTIPGESMTITGRGDVGKAVFRPDPFVPIVRLLALAPKSNVSANFFTYYINSRIIFPLESTGVPQLTVPQVSRISVLVPPISEQKNIANALNDVEELVLASEQLISKKQAIRQGMMQQLLTGKTRLPGFTSEWISLDVAANSHLKARIGWQGLTVEEYKDSGDYGLIGGTNFSDGRVNWSSTPYVDKWRFDQDPNIQVQDSDILITKDGSIGKVAFVQNIPRPSTLNSGVFLLRPKNRSYDSGFLYYLFRSRAFDEFVDRLSAGSTINHLYQRDLKTLKFFVPSDLVEQKTIAQMLFDIDAELTVHQRRLEQIRDVKRGLMQELLTGRTRLISTGE